ncbi:M48 family metalloprotease [Candidatus Woesearchaeota archaeon]|nr:M48 family metalloprotease [Candidatus Woesearchaeota archaeon]
MVCNECAFSFFNDPLMIGIVLASVAVAAASLFMMLRKSTPLNMRVLLVYVNVFAILFPFVYYLFFNGCKALFSGCSSLMPTLYLLGITGMLSAIIGSLAAPVLFVYSKSFSARPLEDRHLAGFVSSEAERMGIKPPAVYLVDQSRPVAFSFSSIRPAIFLSVGLLDLLKRRESEAVLLHELMHIKRGAPFVKFSAFFARLFSPVSLFTSFRHELSEEEAMADEFAARRQGTRSYIDSAKASVDEYSYFENILKGGVK